MHVNQKTFYIFRELVRDESRGDRREGEIQDATCYNIEEKGSKQEKKLIQDQHKSQEWIKHVDQTRQINSSSSEGQRSSNQ